MPRKPPCVFVAAVGKPLAISPKVFAVLDPCSVVSAFSSDRNLFRLFPWVLTCDFPPPTPPTLAPAPTPAPRPAPTNDLRPLLTISLSRPPATAILAPDAHISAFVRLSVIFRYFPSLNVLRTDPLLINPLRQQSAADIVL